MEGNAARYLPELQEETQKPCNIYSPHHTYVIARSYNELANSSKLVLLLLATGRTEETFWNMFLLKDTAHSQ